MTVRETSFQAYRKILADGTNESQIAIVYRALKENGPMSRRQISKITGFEINAVCGRVNALIKRGICIDDETMIDPVTNKEVAVVRAYDLVLTQRELFDGG